MVADEVLREAEQQDLEIRRAYFKDMVNVVAAGIGRSLRKG